MNVENYNRILRLAKNRVKVELMFENCNLVDIPKDILDWRWLIVDYWFWRN